KSGEWASAQAFYQRAEDQGYPAAARAQIMLITGRYHELIDEFVGANDPELLYLTVQALRRVGQVEQAIERLNQLFSLAQVSVKDQTCELARPNANEATTKNTQTALDLEKKVTLKSRARLLHG